MTKNKSIDVDYFPNSLLEYTRNTFGKQFTDLPKRIQTGYIKVFYNHYSIIKSNQHNRDPESWAMGRSEVSRYFTDPKDFRAVNDKGYYLKPKSNRHGPIENAYTLKRKAEPDAIKHQPTNWVIKTVEAFQGTNNTPGCMNGYRLQPAIIKMVLDWVDKLPEHLINQRHIRNNRNDLITDFDQNYEGSIIRTISDTDKATNINTLVRINTEALILFMTQLESLLQSFKKLNLNKIKLSDKQHKKLIVEMYKIDTELTQAGTTPTRGALARVNREIYSSKALEAFASKDIEKRKVIQQIDEIKHLLVIARELKTNAIYVIYKEVGTGRYFAVNGRLQGYSRAVRYAALQGYYEYDLEAAHQNILIQVLDQHSIEIAEIDVVREYVANKQLVRNRLAEELGLSLKNVKTILQALTYGAKLSRSRHEAIYKVCDANIKVIENVVTNGWLRRYMTAFKLASKALSEHDIGSVNAVGIKFIKTKDSQRMAHILQGYERQVIDAIIKHLDRSNIALLVHDCIVTYDRISPKLLSDIVQQETGFNLEFSEEKY
jgi:hypothetical protein